MQKLIENLVSRSVAFFVTARKTNAVVFMPDAVPDDAELTGPIRAVVDPALTVADAARELCLAGNSLIKVMAARGLKTRKLRRFLRSVLHKDVDDAWEMFPKIELSLHELYDRELAATNAPTPTPTPTPTPARAEGFGPLADFLKSNPAATDTDAAATVGLTLDALRKHPTWRKHLNDRLASLFETNPAATLTDAARFLGVAKSTVTAMESYRRTKPSRKPSKAKKRGNVSPNRAARIPDGRKPRTDPRRDVLHADAYSEDADSPAALQGMLLNVFDGETESSQEHRSKVHRLTVDELSALKLHLKCISDRNNPELLRLTIEQWLDAH